MGKPIYGANLDRQSYLQNLGIEQFQDLQESGNAPQGSRNIASDSKVPRDSQRSTLDSDWQLDSLLLMAESVYASMKAQTHLPANTGDVLCKLISKFISAARFYYTTGINDLKLGEKVPALREDFTRAGFLSDRQPARSRRRAIMEDISVEWTRLSALIGSAQLLRADDPAIRLLHTAFLVARHDLKLFQKDANWQEPDFVVLPHVGRHFELVSFNYEPSIFVLGIPIGSLYCPWDLSLIWHEMAGIYVRSHASNPESVILALAGKLAEVMRREGVWDTWRQEFGGDLERLPKGEDGYLTKSVIQGWAEEFVEDSAGLLCLGTPMLYALEGALRATYESDELDEHGAALELVAPGPDTRHPPMELRLAFARSLLFKRDHPGQRDTDSPDGIDDLADLIWSRHADIVTAPFSSADERGLTPLLDVLRKGANLSEWPYAQPMDDAKGLHVSEADVAWVHLLIAGSSLAFSARLSGGEQIRRIVYGPERTDRPAIEDHKFSPDTQRLLREALSVSDELKVKFGSETCSGGRLTVTLKGACAVHAVTVDDTRVTISVNH